MNKVEKLLDMMKNADPFRDELWSEVLYDNIIDYTSNFSKIDWEEVVSVLPIKDRNLDYCILETVINSAPNEIVSQVIEKMVNVICEDTDFLQVIYRAQNNISKKIISDKVKLKLKNACLQRQRTIKSFCEIELKFIDKFLKEL